MLKLLATTALALTASMAQAATVSEAAHGEFSKNFAAPTVFGDTVSAVSGTGTQNQFDFLHFSGLTTGAQTVTMDFGYIGDHTNDNRTASIVYSTSPLAGAWGSLSEWVLVGPSAPATQQVTLSFDDSFAGDLYLGMLFYSGNNMTYNITGTGFASDSAAGSAPAVPLPAGIWLGLSALGALGLAAQRRKA